MSKWEGFSFADETIRLEDIIIGQALFDAEGKVSVAARLLGIHYQALCQRLNGRNKGVRDARNKPVPRRRKSKL